MKDLRQYTDVEIIQRILKGEFALFEILIRRYNSCLYKTGRAYNYNHEDTQDLMQDTLMGAYNNLANFQNRASFKTWVIKIMLNNCFKRKEKFSFKHEVTQGISDQSIPMFSTLPNSDTNKTVMNRELSAVIENALKQVPLDYRLVFSLREINGLNVAETAEALHISEANVKVRLNRVKTMLRKEIEKTYSAEDIFEFNLKYCESMASNVMQKLNSMNQNNHSNTQLTYPL